MMRTLAKLALCSSLTILAISSDAIAGRGGGRGGMQGSGGRGGMQGGGGSRDGGGMQGGRGYGGGMQGGGGNRGGGGYGGGGSHSPAFSQPRTPTNRSSTGTSNPYASRTGTGSRNSESSNPNAKAAAGAGAAKRNQPSTLPNSGAAAAGAGVAKRNQPSTLPNSGAAAAGAGVAKRNQPSTLPNSGAAVAGAGAANRNQGQYPNAGAAAVGAGVSNRNQNPYPNAGAAAGATYANRNQYDQYHPGMAGGYWNGNYGVSAVGGYGGVAAWGTGSSAYGYGYSAYSNPYSGGIGGGGGVDQPSNPAQPAAALTYDYSQPLNTAAAPPEPTAAEQGSSAMAQARQSFQSGDYDTAFQLTQQALGQMPNDATLHEFLGLILFAQGSYERAAAPLYAVLSVGPGWDWTTLIANYSDADIYTQQLRGLEAYVKANPRSAKAQFVLAYHYITQGHGEAAIRTLENVVALQPNDTLSPQLLGKLQPTIAPAVAPEVPSQPQPFDAGKLTGVWVAQPQNATIRLSIKDDGSFEWAVDAPGKPPVKIKGMATVADGVLTLNSEQANVGNMAGNILWQDDQHFRFRAVGAASDDPGLKFAR